MNYNIKCHIVGSRYYNTSFDINDTVSKSPIILIPEPNNVHDKNAVAAYLCGEQIGHINRDAAAEISPMIMAGMTATVFVQNIEDGAASIPIHIELVDKKDHGKSAPPRPAKEPKVPTQPLNPVAPTRPHRDRSDGHKPTDEQRSALDLFATDGSLRINAFAGTGKTSTLQMLAHSTERRGQYIAFNNSTVKDAKNRFPHNVGCNTTHGLAYQATVGAFGRNNEKMVGKINPKKLAVVLNINNEWNVDNNHSLSPLSLSFLIQDTIRSFCQSGDETILDQHVPKHGSLLTASDETISRVNDYTRQWAEHVWRRMCTPDDPVPLGFDGFLKFWALSNPRIAADFILLDEAQDTNPVVLEVLKQQDAQLVYVGDQYQQIYEWRGAVNAMKAIETDHEVKLTQSFRFGPKIASAASLVLQRLGETNALTGNASMKSKVGQCQPDTILARTNANVMVSLLLALDDGRRPHLVGGTAELMAMLRGVQDLKARKPSIVPDFFGFSDWRDVVEFADTQEGAYLLTFVNLVEDRGEQQLMAALNRTFDEADANLVLSTAHKAKGREWAKVQLFDDFLPARPISKGSSKADQKKAGDEFDAELRLFYVAMTRARDVIDIPSSLLEKIGANASVQAPQAGAVLSPVRPADAGSLRRGGRSRAVVKPAATAAPKPTAKKPAVAKPVARPSTSPRPAAVAPAPVAAKQVEDKGFFSTLLHFIFGTK